MCGINLLTWMLRPEKGEQNAKNMDMWFEAVRKEKSRESYKEII